MSNTNNLLIVDDEEMIRETISDYMTDMGFKTRTASSGEEALAILTDEDFTHATVDMRLGGMTGVDFIVKAHKIRQNMKFIIFTGSCEFTLPDELAMIGVTRDHILQKPVRLSVIAKAIKDL
jgi:ActR/RegA family two-component response regulator